MKQERRINRYVPQVPDLEKALEIYYAKIEFLTKDIRGIFGNISKSKVYDLKVLARQEMRAKGKDSFVASAVNGVCAFAAWGLDPAEMERRINKIRKLKKADTNT